MNVAVKQRSSSGGTPFVRAPDWFDDGDYVLACCPVSPARRWFGKREQSPVTRRAAATCARGWRRVVATRKGMVAQGVFNNGRLRRLTLLQQLRRRKTHCEFIQSDGKKDESSEKVHHARPNCVVAVFLQNEAAPEDGGAGR